MKGSQYISFRRKRNKISDPSPAASALFSQLKEVFKPYHEYFEISIDTSDEFEAVTKNEVRVNRGSFRTGASKISFLLIRLNKEFVKLQFHALFLDKNMIDTVPPELLILKTHAITFQFKTLDPPLQTQLDTLIRQGIELYKTLKYIR
jgi:hypothetical protein